MNGFRSVANNAQGAVPYGMSVTMKEAAPS
jgi:hypothetical protein